MKFIKKSASAIGKLLTVLILAVAFLFGLGGVVYMSLQGAEVKVPEIVGKNFYESEKELASLGLRLKKRADRYSQEPPNTILEQLPRPGDTVKTGQLILVVTSKPNPEGEEAPATIQKGNQQNEDDSKKIEELISDKPKRKDTNANSNRKKASTTRDVVKSANTASNTASTENKSSTDKDTDRENKSNSLPPGAKQPNSSGSPKPAVTKTPSSGDIRERRSP